MKTDKKLVHLIGDLETAAVNLSWKGGLPPEDWPGVEGRYRKAKRRLYEFLRLPVPKKLRR